VKPEIQDVICRPKGGGIKFVFTDGSEEMVPVSAEVNPAGNAQLFVDMTMAAAILHLHQRLEKLEGALS